MGKNVLTGVIILALFILLSNAFGSVYASKEEVRVILIPEKDKNIKFKAFKAGSLSGIKFIRRLKFKNGIVALIPKRKIKELENQGFKVYLDYKLKAFLTESVPLINANKVWKVTLNSANITGKGVSVCVIDTGVDYTHPDLGNCTKEEFLSGNCEKVVAGYDFVNNDTDPMDDNGHGTHVAGIIAANGTIKGVAPDAKIVAVKALDNNGVGNASDVIDAIWWCVNHSKEYNISVISMSLGAGLFSDYCDNDYLCDENGCFPLSFFSEVINAAVAKGISVVVATGNEYETDKISSPACIYNATRVSATNKTDYIADFANRGGNFTIILMAPGVDILSTVPPLDRCTGDPTHAVCSDSLYLALSGTSMATPHVSGVIALLKQVNASLEPKEIEDILNDTGKMIYDPESQRNYPRIDAYGALKVVITPVVSNFSVSPFYGNLTTNFTFSLNYTHAANVSPVYVRVCIDTECRNMVSQDNNFADGSIFTFSTNLSYGIHNFSFEVSDGLHVLKSDIFQGPWVADEFWLNKEMIFNSSNILENTYVISNSSSIRINANITFSKAVIHLLRNANINISENGTLTLNNSFFSRDISITSYGNLILFNQTLHCKNVSLFNGYSTIENSSILCNMFAHANLYIFNSSLRWVNVFSGNLTVENSRLNISLEDSNVSATNCEFDAVNVSGYSTIYGYFSLNDIAFNENSSLNRFYPVLFVKDFVNKIPVERNVSIYRNSSLIQNFTSHNGFVWVNATFSSASTIYTLWIEDYGFARVNNTIIILSPLTNTTEDIVIDVVFPQAENISVSTIFISPLSSPGVKDNVSITFNVTEAAEKCLLVRNSSNITVFYSCGENFVWEGSDENGNYSIWLNLTDLAGNINVTFITNVTVDNTPPEIHLDIPPIVINGTSVNVSLNLEEEYPEYVLVNISTDNETLILVNPSQTFKIIPNHTANHTIYILVNDSAGNYNEKVFWFLSRPKRSINISATAPSPVNISFLFDGYKLNESLVENETMLILPDWVLDLVISLNKTFEAILKDVNISVTSNISIKLDKPEVEGYLATYAVKTEVNFTRGRITISYNETNYTNEDYLGIYICANWNFSSRKCEGNWQRIESFVPNKTKKTIEFNVTHFSAFAIKQEPYCGDGIINQEWEECDTNDFGGKTCESFGYDYGMLICTADCEISFSGCGFFRSKASRSGGYLSSQKTVKKNETEKEIVNISLICPENLTFSSKNVSFEILVLNSGNASAAARIIVEPINISAEINLSAGEGKTLAFTAFLKEGMNEIVATTQNSSCRFFINISLPEIYRALKEKIASLKILSQELNLSSKELEMADTMLENENYERAKNLVEASEKKIEEKLEEILLYKELKKEELKKRYLRRIFGRMVAFFAIFFLSLAAIHFLKKRFNFLSRR